MVTSTTSATARSNASAFALEGFADPLILRTYCSAEAWISSSVAGGSKLWSVLMFRHIRQAYPRRISRPTAPISSSVRSSCRSASPPITQCRA